MKLKFTCISKIPPFALNDDWHIDLQMVEQQGIKLKELIQIDASPAAAEIFEIGAEYEMTFTKVKDNNPTEYTSQNNNLVEKTCINCWRSYLVPPDFKGDDTLFSQTRDFLGAIRCCFKSFTDDFHCQAIVCAKDDFTDHEYYSGD